MNDKVAYWLDLAEYDLDTAKAMLKLEPLNIEARYPSDKEQLS